MRLILFRSEFKIKKLVCQSFMANRVKSGWIEIDMRQVIKQWEKNYRHNTSINRSFPVEPMVAIDVEDEYQTPLMAGLFFEPIDCQACKCAVIQLLTNITEATISFLFSAQLLFLFSAVGNFFIFLSFLHSTIQ